MPYPQEDWVQFEKQLAFVKMNEQECRTLQELASHILPHLPEIIDVFYQHLQSFPVTQSFLIAPERVEQIKRAQYQYFQQMLEGKFDERYFEERKNIGDSHVRNGMPPKWYIGAYAFYCETLFPLIQNLLEKNPGQGLAAQVALVKAFFLDIQIAIESYIRNYADELVEARTALEKKLWMEDRLLSFILSEATDAIVGLDEQDRICTWSQGAQRIFGYKTTEILDKSFADLTLKSDTVQQLKQEALEKGYTTIQGEYWRTKEGAVIDADATLTYLIDRHGNHTGSTLLIQDRTEARMLAEKVKNMEQLTAMTKITAGVAHEIRTPLGVIVLTSDLLKNRLQKILSRDDFPVEEEDKQDVYDMISDLQMEVDRLNEIVDHYLVLSRIRRPQKNRIQLRPFLKTVAEELAAKKSKKQIQWELQTQDNLLVEIDTDQFRRVFHNLNDNSQFAIAQKGTISLTAFSDNKSVYIIFRDDGVGIPKDRMRGIFSAFVTHRSGGTGLGLYLVREIVEAHQGTVSIDSEPGKGTAVLITLPLIQNEGPFQDA